MSEVTPEQRAALRSLRDQARSARRLATRSHKEALGFEQRALELDQQADRECHGHPNRRSTMFQGSQEQIECLDCGKVWWD